MKPILTILIAFLFLACTGNSNENEVESDYEVALIQNGDADWGYQILKEQELFINQPHIPAIPGKKGFSTREKALKTGEYIIDKLNKGIMPPTITKAELDNLGVLD